MSVNHYGKDSAANGSSYSPDSGRLGGSPVAHRTIALDSLETQSAIIVTDSKRRIEWVNASFSRLTGYVLDDVRGKSPAILQGPNTDRQTVSKIRGCLERGQGFVEDILNYKINGEPYWAHVEVCPLRNGGDSKPSGYLGIHSDITELKKDNIQLRTFRMAVEESPSTIVITDVRGIIRYVNPAFEHSTGYTTNEAIG